MASVMLRSDPETRQRLRELAAAAGCSMREMLARLVEAYEDDQYIAELNAGYAELRKDPKAWAEELEEQALWDRTLMDGLEAEG